MYSSDGFLDEIVQPSPRVKVSDVQIITGKLVNATTGAVQLAGSAASVVPTRWTGAKPTTVGEKVVLLSQGGLLVGLSGQAPIAHARGGLSGSVPNATATKLTQALHAGSGVTVSGTTATLSLTGYWALHATVSSSVAATSTSRAFTSLLLTGTPDSMISRSTYGTGESFLGVSAMAYLTAGAKIAVDYYNNAGASTIGQSFFYYRYLGEG